MLCKYPFVFIEVPGARRGSAPREPCGRGRHMFGRTLARRHSRTTFYSRIPVDYKVMSGIPLDSTCDDVVLHERVQLVDDFRVPICINAKDTSLVLDVRHCFAQSLHSETEAVLTTNVLRCLNEFTCQISSFRLSGSNLTEENLERIYDCLFPSIQNQTQTHTKVKYPSLVELELANLKAPEKYILSLSRILSPVLSGYCPIKRLVLSYCNLGLNGSRQLVQSIRGNMFIEEFIITGNHCGDAIIPDLHKTMLGQHNRMRILGLGSNNLSEGSMKTLADIIRKDAFLHELRLSGNGLRDFGTSLLMNSLIDNLTLVKLDLSNCGLKHCDWAPSLTLMAALSEVNMSCNSISDQGCESLATSLMKNCSIRHLDLSNNLFGSRLSMKLGDMLEHNASLLSLNLSRNIMTSQCWKAISIGISKNRTLLSLNVTNCNILLESAHELYQALSQNNVLDLHIDGNPIPDMLRLYPRRYRHNAICHALTSSFQVADMSMRESHLWRSERLTDIKATKFTQAIIEGRNSSKIKDDVNDDSPTNINIEPKNDHTYDQIDLLSVSTSHVENSEKKDKNESSDVSMTNNRDINVDDDEMLNIQITLDVYYGRQTEHVGNIVVDNSTTYPKAKELITPLIQAYVKSIGNMHTAEFLVSNFEVLDNKGETVTGPKAEVRTIGMEAKVNDYKVIVRPATWLTMDNN